MTTKPQRGRLSKRGALTLAATAVVLAAVPGAAAAAPRPLLPDLTQSVPTKVSVATVGAQHQLIFESVANNIGRGHLIVDGSKTSADPNVPMVASQAFQMSDGTIRANAVADVGEIYYDFGHGHWHLREFEQYWLRRTDTNATVAGDNKAGFCLGDRRITFKLWKLPGQSYDPNPLYSEDCWMGVLDRTSIREGISVGWGDDYAPQLEGQWIDVTSVPDGRYYLVHTANPAKQVKETDYRNNSSSLLIELERSSAGAAPAVRTVAKCALTARCDPTRKPRLKRKPRVVGAVSGRVARCERGSWTGKPRRFYYQWYRFGYALPSARSATYRVTSDDAGKPLQCEVVALGTYGTGKARSANAVAKG